MYITIPYIRGFFACHNICEDGGKSDTFLICVSYFLQLKEFLIENDTGYNFCLFNYLRFKRDRKKSEN